MTRSIAFILGFLIAAITSMGDTDDLSRHAIRRVDFLNFIYTPACTFTYDGRHNTVGVVDGVYRRHLLDFSIRQIAYGDLTGDGLEEAVVVSRCNHGGTGWFDEGFVFELRRGIPTLLTRIEGGDRAAAGIVDVRVADGRLQVGRYGGANGRCCPDWIETRTYRLDGTRLIEVGRPTRRPHTGGW